MTSSFNFDTSDLFGAACHINSGVIPTRGGTRQRRASHPNYIPVTSDVGHTLRLQITATNATKAVALASTPTGIAQSGPAVVQMGDTSTGFTSVYVHTTTELSSIFTAPSSGTTTDFEFFARGAGGTQIFTPKIYSVTNGAGGALLATGTAITVPMGTNGQWYVSSLSGVHLAAGAQYVPALDPSGANSTYVGAETEQRNVILRGLRAVTHPSAGRPKRKFWPPPCPPRALPHNGPLVKGILRPDVPARTLAQHLDLR